MRMDRGEISDHYRPEEEKVLWSISIQVTNYTFVRGNEYISGRIGGGGWVAGWLEKDEPLSPQSNNEMWSQQGFDS